MITFGNSKRNQIAHHLKKSGFFKEDFRYFQIITIVDCIIDDHSLLAPLAEVLKEIKVTSHQALKIQLIVHHLLQADVKMQENEILLQILVDLEIQVKQMINIAAHHVGLVGDIEGNMVSHREHKSEQVCQNEMDLLLKKIISPLLILQKRLIYCHDLVYPPPNTPKLELSECWAVLNLLKKFV